VRFAQCMFSAASKSRAKVRAAAPFRGCRLVRQRRAAVARTHRRDSAYAYERQRWRRPWQTDALAVGAALHRRKVLFAAAENGATATVRRASAVRCVGYEIWQARGWDGRRWLATPVLIEGIRRNRPPAMNKALRIWLRRSSDPTSQPRHAGNAFTVCRPLQKCRGLRQIARCAVAMPRAAYHEKEVAAVKRGCRELRAAGTGDPHQPIHEERHVVRYTHAAQSHEALCRKMPTPFCRRFCFAAFCRPPTSFFHTPARCEARRR